MIKYGILLMLLAAPAYAGEYTVTPVLKPGAGEAAIVPGTGPQLPIIPGSVVAQGYIRPLTQDEKDAKRLIRKAARAAHVKVPKFGAPCVVPLVAILPAAGDPAYVVDVDDRCAVRINVYTGHADGEDDPVNPPDLPTPPAASIQSVTPHSTMTSYSERSYPGQCSKPAQSAPSCGYSGYTNLAYVQTFLIDPGDPVRSINPHVVTRSTAYGLWHFTKGTTQNVPTPCSQATIDADRNAWYACSGPIEDRYQYFVNNQAFEHWDLYIRDVMAQCANSACDITVWPSNVCWFTSPVCYKTQPVPAKVDCYDSVSYVEGLAGETIFSQFLDTGWFPRFPEPSELVDLSKDSNWVFYQFPLPQGCPASSASGFYHTWYRPPGGGTGVNINPLAFGEAGFFQRENNFHWLVLTVVGNILDDQLGPDAKLWLEAALPHIKTEMPHWALAALSSDSQGHNSSGGNCGGNIGAAPFFKKLRCVTNPPVFAGI